MSEVTRHTLIVDPHAASRGNMARLLTQALPDLPVCEAETRAQADAAIAEHDIELALIDFGLPDGSGLDVLRAIHQAQPLARVVVISLLDDDAHVFPALRAGAFGYLLKDRPEVELVAQLRRIRDGEPPLSSAIALRLLQHFSSLQAGAMRDVDGDGIKWGRRATDVPGAPAARADLSALLQVGRAGFDEPEVVLTERETEVLQRVGKGYTLPEIAQQLGLSRHTVADYVKQVYRKLDISSRAEAALEAARRGLVR
jgi:DNA-binding NarL/FixJ family response regulator